MKHLATIDIQGEEVLVIYHDQKAKERSKHVVEARMGNMVEFPDRTYASFHDDIPHYTREILNHQIRRNEYDE